MRIFRGFVFSGFLGNPKINPPILRVVPGFTRLDLAYGPGSNGTSTSQFHPMWINLTSPNIDWDVLSKAGYTPGQVCAPKRSMQVATPILRLHSFLGKGAGDVQPFSACSPISGRSGGPVQNTGACFSHFSFWGADPWLLGVFWACIG